MTPRRITLLRRFAVAGAALVLGGTLLWAGARPVGDPVTRPAVTPPAGIVAQGAAAFEGAAFGGISVAAL